MRVLLLAKRYPPEIGGIATAVRGMARALAAAGHLPFVLCTCRSGEGGDTEEAGVRVRRAPVRRGVAETSLPYSDLRWLSSALPEAKLDFRPQQIWSCWTNFSISLARLHEPLPFLHLPPSAHPVSFQGLLGSVHHQWRSARVLANVPFWLMARRRAAAWEREALRASVRTIVFSKNVERQYASLYPEYANKVVVIPPGCDAERFQGVSRDEAERRIRLKWGIHPSRRIFLYVGRLEADKFVDLLLAALIALKRTAPAVLDRSHLLVVGEGSRRDWLAARACSGGLPVTFCGVQREELEDHYSGAWSLVVPSKVESFGLVMLEAALCSTPSIAFRPDGRSVRTAADEIILEGRTGFLAEPATPTALADAICQATALSPERRFEMGREARRWVAENFDWARFVREAAHGVPSAPTSPVD